MNCCFAIVPDGRDLPTAIFENLEDAMDWALARYGDNQFAIRHVTMTELPTAERRAS